MVEVFNRTKNKNDEFYTPNYAIRPILEYLKPNSTIWCPFDTKESNYVKIFKNEGHKVINSHIINGEDFFEFSIPDCDYIISNPPYSLKTEIIEELFKIKKPFAMLIGILGMFESQKRFELYKNNKFEIMYFNRRVSFFKSYSDQKPLNSPPFSSAYICSNFLPEQIIFKELNKKDY